MKNIIITISGWILLLILTASAVADTFIVSTTIDSGPGSLRQAILDANSQPGPDKIDFAISLSDAGYNSSPGTWTIKPSSELPNITDAGLTIDGFSQSIFIGSDKNPDGPEVVIDGSLIPYQTGLSVKSDGCIIKELVINNFSHGNAVLFSGAVGGQLSGCYVGTDAAGMIKKPNFYGIIISDQSQHIRISPQGDKPSIISANRNVGITIGLASMFNEIAGNIIGLNRTCSDTLGNAPTRYYGGIFIGDGSDSNQVYDNCICGNRFGIMIYHCKDTIIRNNLIGTNGDWLKTLGNTNYGIYITADPAPTVHSSTGTLIIHNQIAFSGSAGIILNEAASRNNRISENSIWNNGDCGGIVLDSGANKNLAAPVISSVAQNTVTGQAGASNAVEIFCDEKTEGRMFLGKVTADAGGNFSFVITPPIPFQNITATATDSDGNTSAFSRPVNTLMTNRKENPASYSLLQNYPNPFNAATTIRFSVPRKQQVKMSVFDVLGREVAILFDGELNGGEHLIHWDATDMTSGIYVIQVHTGEYKKSRKCVLIK